MKYKFLYTLSISAFFLLGISSSVFSQLPIWAKSLGADTEAKQIATDKSGNTYMLTHKNSIGVHKYDKNGLWLWSKTIALGNVSNSNNWISLDIDQNGNLIISGSFEIGGDVDPGPGTVILSTAGYTDFFVEKLDPNGIFQWVKQFGGTGRDFCRSMKLDFQDNIFLTGDIEGTIDFDPGPGVYNSTGADGDMYICKLSSSGNFVQVARLGQQTLSKVVQPASLTFDASNNIIITGEYICSQDSIDFDPGTGTFYINQFSPHLDIFVLKLDYNMGFKWAKKVNSTIITAESNWAISVKTDASRNIYFTGIFYGTIDADPGPGVYNLTALGVRNIFIIKLSASGDFVFGKRIGNTTYIPVTGMAIDSYANIFLTGDFYSTVDFDPGPGTANMTSNNGDVFLVKLNSNGEYLWATYVNGTAADNGGAITVDSINNIYLAGIFGGGFLYFYNLPPITPTLSSDVFICKYGDANNILGNTFYDLNGNGIKDAPDFSLRGVVTKAVSATKTFYGLSDSLGLFNMQVDSGNYTVSVAQLPLYYSAAVPLTQSANFGLLIGRVDSLNNFGLVPILNKNDLEIKVTNITAARPGFNTTYHLSYKNTGTTTLSGTITLQHAPQLNYVNAIPAATSYNNPVITWNFNNLQPSFIAGIDIIFNVPAGTAIGTNLQSLATINPVAGDETPVNNTDTLNHIVTSGFDPNAKSVMPDGNILPAFVLSGQYLDYTVRFQNTGNDTAFNIIIKDSLSNNLEISSFEVISTSHNCSTKFQGSGIVVWTFSNILLPDSNRNEPKSHGFIRYRIKPKNTLVIGDQIKNKAYIIFDYNGAIITNETINTVSLTSDSLQTPILKNIIPVICSSVVTNIGKLLNPPSPPAVITITMDGNINIPFVWSDSSFTYNVATAGNHIIKVVYAKNAISKYKDSAFTSIASPLPIISITSPSATICAGATIIFTATTTNGGSSPVYQWKKNGINVGTNSAVFSSNTITNGDIISATLTSNVVCASPVTVNSNAITITVNAVNSSINISGNTTIMQGTTTTILSAVSNSGTTPSYQWQDSISTHTWQNINGATSSTFDYTLTEPGNKLRCLLTVFNSSCSSSFTVISNVLLFNGNLTIKDIRLYPNPVSSELIIDQIKITGDWETIDIISADGKKSMTGISIVNRTSVSINVQNLAKGVYIAVLNRYGDEPIRLKFVKL